MSDVGGGGTAAAAVNPAAFAEQPADREPKAGAAPSSLDLIMDVTVPVTVGIGSMGKTVSEILALAPGQVIDLDRAAGEPVDLYVHDRLVARGEVVVVGDRYGFRVTEIVAAAERAEHARR